MSGTAIEIESLNGKKIRGSFQEPFNLSGDLINPVLMIFFHGFPENLSESYTHTFPKLQNICASLGIFSLCFNYTGCGASDGKAENFTLTNAKEDLDAVKKWCVDKNFKRFMICAEGLGSIIALQSFYKDIMAGMFLSPVFQTEDYAIRNLSAETYKDKLAQEDGYADTDHGKISLGLIKELLEIDVEPLMNRVEYPCLIQHGAKDEFIPIEFLDMASAYFRNRRIEITTYQDGTYGLPKENHMKNLMYHFEQFIQKYI